MYRVPLGTVKLSADTVAGRGFPLSLLRPVQTTGYLPGLSLEGRRGKATTSSTPTELLTTALRQGVLRWCLVVQSTCVLASASDEGREPRRGGPIREEGSDTHAGICNPKGSAAAAVLCAASTPKGSARQDMLRAAYTLEGLCAASSLPFVLS